MTHSTDETRIGSTLRLISKAEQAEATGTIEIQRNFIGSNLLKGRVPAGPSWKNPLL